MDAEFSLPKRTAQMVGQAGTHYAAMELFKVGIATAHPTVDTGYDIITDAGGVLKRCQVKSELEGFADRQELHQVRFNMRRRRAKFSNQNVGESRDKQYTLAMIDVMICVTMKHNKIFIVPASEIDFTKDWLYYSQLAPYENAWHVLMTPANAAAQQEMVA
jgi:hypothetical protein